MNLQGLDHVALTVSDLAASTAWYQTVLGLRRVHEDVWGEVPAMLVAEGWRTGLALFPADPGEPPADAPNPRTTRIMRHLAFRADRATFEAARARLSELGIAFEFSDHTVAHSIYFTDPDGYRLEITTYEIS